VAEFIHEEICDAADISRILEVHYLYVTPNLERQRERRSTGAEKNGSVTVNGKMLKMPAPHSSKDEHNYRASTG
jgi:hypothetical protein